MPRPNHKPAAKVSSGDGRANPAQFDLTKVTAFKSDAGVTKVQGKAAKLVVSTPIAHQSGKGTRGIRENLNGHSKVSVIRWAAAHGLNYDRTWVFVARTFTAMTRAVFSKAWAEGERGDRVPDLDRETAAMVQAG